MKPSELCFYVETEADVYLKRQFCLVSALTLGTALLREKQDDIPASTAFDKNWITQQIKNINNSVVENQRDIRVKISLRLLELHSVLLLDEVAGFQRKLESRDTNLERFDRELTRRLMEEYGRLLRQRKQFHVLGVIEFLEEEIFPQYPDYRATLEKLVHDHCKKEM